MTNDEIRRRALSLLARREHTRLELTEKLCARGFDSAAVDVIVQRLQDQGLLSDERFAEVFARQRVAKGYGPVRIRAELRQRGVEDAVIAAQLDVSEGEWNARLDELVHKRFGSALPETPKEKLSRARFLQGRGFTTEQIRRVLGR